MRTTDGANLTRLEQRKVRATYNAAAPDRTMLRRIEPTFGPMPNGLLHKGIGAFEPINSSWSGVEYSVPSPAGFKNVQATFSVPNIGVPSFVTTFLKSNKWRSQWDSQTDISVWVGFDPGTPALWQGGFDTVGSVHDTPSSTPLPTSYAWWELVFGGPLVEDWVLKGKRARLEQVVKVGKSPKGKPIVEFAHNNITNFPVSPGDLVAVSIEKLDPSVFSGTKVARKIKGAAKFEYINFTSGLITSFKLGATTPLVGQQVEWIVEAPSPGSGVGGVVPGFGAVYFDNANCSLGRNNFGIGQFTPGAKNKHKITATYQPMTTGTGKFFSKGVSANEVVSKPFHLADNLVRLSYVLNYKIW